MSYVFFMVIKPLVMIDIITTIIRIIVRITGIVVRRLDKKFNAAHLEMLFSKVSDFSFNIEHLT